MLFLLQDAVHMIAGRGLYSSLVFITAVGPGVSTATHITIIIQARHCITILLYTMLLYDHYTIVLSYCYNMIIQAAQFRAAILQLDLPISYSASYDMIHDSKATVCRSHQTCRYHLILELRPP